MPNTFDFGGYPLGMARNPDLTGSSRQPAYPSKAMQAHYDVHDEDDAEEPAPANQETEE